MTMPGELHRIEQLLAAQIGLDPVSVGSRLILRAAQRRMKELELDELSDYERRLCDSKQELQSLAEQVVVPESWFFRDARPYEWFRAYIRTRWLIEPARPPVRVLSMACASGEEPYSIAITMSDLGLPACRFQIDAVDISSRRLAKARKGVYSANAFRGCDPGYRKRFFHEQSGGFEIDLAIRSMVRFFEGNVLDPQFLDRFSVYDVIFCRNLLIYLHPEARASVTAALDRLLAADGMLVIGHADRFEWRGQEPKFTAAGQPSCFVYSRSASELASRAEPKREPPEESPNSVAMESSAKAAEVLESDAGRLPTSTPTVGIAPVSVPAGDPRSHFDLAASLANQGRHVEAIAACQRDLQVRGHTASAYYLLGMIYQSQGDRRQAEACFYKTVYLDPNHDEAILVLALLLERRGAHKAAESFRRRAARIAALTRDKVT